MDYDVIKFIQMHNETHKCYCEIIIYPSGLITYAEPSHLMKLQEIWGVPKNQLFEGGPVRDKLCQEMPQWASPVHWLSEVLNCVVAWYDAIIFPPNYTENQIQSVKELIKNGCISDEPSLEVTMEYRICQDDNRKPERAELIYKHKEEVMSQIMNRLCIKTY